MSDTIIFYDDRIDLTDIHFIDNSCKIKNNDSLSLSQHKKERLAAVLVETDDSVRTRISDLKDGNVLASMFFRNIKIILCLKSQDNKATLIDHYRAAVVNSLIKLSSMCDWQTLNGFVEEALEQAVVANTDISGNESSKEVAELFKFRLRLLKSSISEYPELIQEMQAMHDREQKSKS